MKFLIVVYVNTVTVLYYRSPGDGEVSAGGRC